MAAIMNRLIVPNDGISDDVSDWGSDFDEEIDDNEVQNNSGLIQPHYGDLYEVPDGKPASGNSSINMAMTPSPTATLVPDWLRKVDDDRQNHSPPLVDENVKPQNVYIEHVLLPTRATKDEDSKNFIETLKRKLSQKNLLVQSSGNNNNKTNNGGSGGGGGDPKTGNGGGNSPQHLQCLNKAERELVKNVKESLYKVPWFYRVDRTKAELILENYSEDGSFMVRECHHGGPKVPFTLTMRFRQRLFHIQIRIRPDSQFALGTAKVNEMHFPTIQAMIDTYRKTPLQLHSNGKFFGETILTQPPIVYSYTNI